MRSQFLEVCGEILAQTSKNGPLNMKIRTTLKAGQFHTAWWPASQIKITHAVGKKVVVSIPRWLAQKEALNANSIVAPMREADKQTLVQLHQRLFYIEEKILDQAERRHGSHGPKADDLRAGIATARSEVETAIDNYPMPKFSIPILAQKVKRIETAVKALVNAGPQPPKSKDEEEELKRLRSEPSRAASKPRRARR